MATITSTSNVSVSDKISVLDIEKAPTNKAKYVYELSDYHLKRLEISRQQYANGEFYTEEEMEKKFEEWLKGK